MPRMGEIRQISSTTYLPDLSSPIQEYLKRIGHQGRTVGKSVVWVRYGRKVGHRVAYPLEVGPTKEFVEYVPIGEKKR